MLSEGLRLHTLSFRLCKGHFRQAGPRTLGEPGVAGEVLRAVLGVSDRNGLQRAVRRTKAPAQAIPLLRRSAFAHLADQRA